MLHREHFHILEHVISNRLKYFFRFFEFTLPRLAQTGLVLLLGSALLSADASAKISEREEFSKAWKSAASGNRADFDQLMPNLRDYQLYPYLKYEDLRYRRARVEDEEMASFLAGHQDWAFTPGLQTAWLRTLGRRDKWDSLIRYAPGTQDTEVQCYLSQAKIELGQTEGLLPVAQALWTVGKSQPKACDPVFSWLKKQNGITSGLAWERIRRAMDARQPRLTQYLARFLTAEDRVWSDRWYQQDRTGYRQLDKARNWPDNDKARDITGYGIRRLARSDSDRAWLVYEAIESKFSWSTEERSGILREIALWSAVEGADATAARMQSVPESDRDGTLMEWWVRFDLSRGNWGGVIQTISKMPADMSSDSRWRYWDARARYETQDLERAKEVLAELAQEASYHGFLSADLLNDPYTICVQEPDVQPAAVEALSSAPRFSRALELRKAGLLNWARSEWKLAARELDKAGLRAAAALATDENWPDMAIVALGNSGDRRWYEWRFPLEYSTLVESRARDRNLDPAWVMGLMRSESAMARDAVSSAGALGLMQVMPATARQLARRHSFRFTGKDQLLQPDVNIQFGTAYLRDLMDRFGDNPVLVSGAYNAGPHVVDRWLDKRRTDDPAIWIETLPYFETRDYIPRVLAFTIIYDWRMEKPVSRLSSRMPGFDSGPGGGNMQVLSTAEIVCRIPG